MRKKTVFFLVMSVFIGALAGGAMADYSGESHDTGQAILSSADREFVPEGNWSGTDWQASDPVETGAIPGTVLLEDFYMRDYGND